MKMIACDQHDFIEIACMYHLKVVLKLKTGNEVIGIAQDTILNDERDECVKVLKDNQTYEAIMLSHISTMRAVTSNPHFDYVNFDLFSHRVTLVTL